MEQFLLRRPTAASRADGQAGAKSEAATVHDDRSGPSLVVGEIEVKAHGRGSTSTAVFSEVISISTGILSTMAGYPHTSSISDFLW